MEDKRKKEEYENKLSDKLVELEKAVVEAICLKGETLNMHMAITDTGEVVLHCPETPGPAILIDRFLGEVGKSMEAHAYSVGGQRIKELLKNKSMC